MVVMELEFVLLFDFGGTLATFVGLALAFTGVFYALPVTVALESDVSTAGGLANVAITFKKLEGSFGSLGTELILTV
jgi:hypothetical protein